MDAQEFKTWYADFREHFTLVDSWMKKHADKSVVMKNWKGVLSGTRLDDAMEATRALFAEPDAMPRSYDEYPATVRYVAGKIRSEKTPEHARRTIDGQETFRCPHCRDQGRVTIWDTAYVNAVRCTMSDKATAYQCKRAEAYIKTHGGAKSRCSVKCTCDAALGQCARDERDVFRESRHFVVGWQEPIMVPASIRYGKGLFRGVKHDTMRLQDDIDALRNQIEDRRENGSSVNGSDWGAGEW